MRSLARIYNVLLVEHDNELDNEVISMLLQKMSHQSFVPDRQLNAHNSRQSMWMSDAWIFICWHCGNQMK